MKITFAEKYGHVIIVYMLGHSKLLKHHIYKKKTRIAPRLVCQNIGKLKEYAYQRSINLESNRNCKPYIRRFSIFLSRDESRQFGNCCENNLVD